MRAAVSIAPSPNSTAFMLVAKSLALAKGHRLAAAELAEARGYGPRVVGALKTAVPAELTSTGGMTGLVNSSVISSTFVATLRNASLFYALSGGGMLTRVPFQTRLSFTTANATAFIVGEGAAVPLTNASVDKLSVEPVSVAGLIILTDEMLRSAGNGGESLLSRELRRATVAAVDTKFLSLVIDGDTPTSSSAGNTAADAAKDLRTLLSDVSPTAESRLIFAMAPDVARNAATLTSASGGFMFPDMSPTGGTILNIQAIVCDALASGKMALIDGTGLAGDADLVTVESSDETTIEMSNAPSSNASTGTGSTVVSLFQSNLTGVMVRARFGVTRVRDSAIAMVTDIAWGNTGSGS